MFEFRIRDVYDDDLLAGATLGTQHLQKLLHAMPRAVNHAIPVIIDFDGVVGATGSYLRAFVVALLTSRQGALDPKVPSPDSPNVEVFVRNVSEDVAIDLRGVLVDADLACLEALEADAARVKRARLHGDLDKAVNAAFETVLKVGASTAADLATKNKKDRIGATAWHYRLGELHKLGLVRRIKSDRSWVYEPTVQEVVYG